LSKKTIKYLACLVLTVKLLAVAAGSYPFDFATYVYQGRSFFQYGIPALFLWNKGMPLLGLFYGQYSIYQLFIRLFSNGHENTLLVHIIFKLPLLASDILTAFFIKKIIFMMTNNERLSLYGSYFWLINPFLLWSIEFQGSYAVLAAMCSVISVYYLLKGNYKISIIFLVGSVSIYYYSAIFLPFYILKYAKQKNISFIKSVFNLGTVFIITTLLFYLPYIFSVDFTKELLSSLLNHSAPNAPAFAQSIPLPNFSILKIPYYIFRHNFPTNISSPKTFVIAQLLTLVGLLLIGHLSILRLIKLKSLREYSNELFLADLTISTTIFLVLVGNFQDHYLTLLMPFLIISALSFSLPLILNNTYFLSFIVLVGILGVGNVGIYLIDIIPFGTISIFMPLSSFSVALGGFTVLAILIFNLFAIHHFQKLRSMRSQISLLKFLLALSFCFYIALGIISFAAIVDSLSLHTQLKLGSDSNVYSFTYKPIVKTSIRSNSIQNSIEPKDIDFSNSQLGNLKYGNSKKNYGSWIIYDIKGNGNYASFTKTSAGTSLVLHPNVSGSDFQVNLGGNVATKLVRIDPFELYKISYKVNFNGIRNNDLYPSIRFGTSNNKIIAGSDIYLKPTYNNRGVVIGYYTNFEAPQNAYYVEPVITLNTLTSPTHRLLSNVSLSDFSLGKISYYQTFEYKNLTTQNNIDVNKYLLQSTAKKYFVFQISILQKNAVQNIKSVNLNNCKENQSQIENGYIVTNFNSSCVHSRSKNNLDVTTINNPAPSVQISLVHKMNTISSVNYHTKIFWAYAALGLVIVILSSSCILFMVGRFY
jgi:hypothetical protein